MDAEIVADLSSETFFNFAMARDNTHLAIADILVNRVSATLANEKAIVALKVANEIFSLHLKQPGGLTSLFLRSLKNPVVAPPHGDSIRAAI